MSIILNKLCDEFLANPLKIIFYFIVIISALYSTIKTFLDRTRINITVLSETKEIIPEEMEEIFCLKLRVENLGTKPTSIKPDVTVSGYYHRKKLQLPGKLEQICNLQPHQSVEISIIFPNINKYNFMIFRSYKIRLTRGLSKKFLLWSASLQPISFLRYYYEIMLYKILDMYREPNT